MHATMKAIQACQDLHYIGMAINMLAVSCLPTYRAIAIPVPDQSAKLAVVYCFSHFIWQAVPDLGPIMDKIDFKSIFRRVCLRENCSVILSHGILGTF